MQVGPTHHRGLCKREAEGQNQRGKVGGDSAVMALQMEEELRDLQQQEWARKRFYPGAWRKKACLHTDRF